MKRLIALIAVLAGLLHGGLVTGVWSADLKVIQTQKAKEVVIALKSETGRWAPGKNSFVVEFVSPAGQPLDMGKVALSTSMAMPGMAPMLAGATLTVDRTPGRYLGTIEFPDGGTRQVTVSWEGPAGKGSTRFSVPVR
jgi:YtkA-like protein